MATLLIEYDLNAPGQTYDAVTTYIRNFPSWANHLRSAWFVSTTLTAEQVCNQLLKIVDANDKVMVINVSGDSAAWRGMPDDVSEWIQKNL